MSDRSFDDLMASMGVQKLNPGKARLKAPASIKQAPLSQKHRKNERSPEPPASVPKGPSKAERRLRAELSRAQDAARSAQQELAESEERLASLRAELDKALKDQVAQEANLNRLRTELAVARGDEEHMGSGLSSRLAARGVLGEDERRGALAALGERRILDKLLKRLVVADPSWADDWLRRELVLVCGGESCRGVCGLAEVEVSSARCELCGGTSLEDSARNFVSGMLMNGWRQCRILGGPSWLPRVLPAVLAESRIDFEIVPWCSLPRDGDLQLQGAPDVLLIWERDGEVAPSSGSIEEVKLRVGVHASSLAHLLRESSRAMICNG